MAKILRPLFILLLFTVGSHQSVYSDDESTSLYPADISFLVVDLKYSKEKGAQICEIQEGIPSGFKGDPFNNDGISRISRKFVRNLFRFQRHSWVDLIGFGDLHLTIDLLINPFWKKKRYNLLMQDKIFLNAATLPVEDPQDLSSYHGFVLVKGSRVSDREEFIKKYPGVLLIGNASAPYRANKYEMSNLLAGDPVLEKHKPKWAAYPTVYTEDLHKKIKRELNSSLLVIKPPDSSQGNGVIIFPRKKLDQVLRTILLRERPEIQSSDSAYTYWFTNQPDLFLVEEFADADLVEVPHLKGKHYSPTMRLVYLLIYNKKEIEIIRLGGYNLLPEQPFYESGSFNEIYKPCCVVPYYCKIEPEALKEANRQISEVLEIVYRRMLGLME